MSGREAAVVEGGEESTRQSPAGSDAATSNVLPLATERATDGVLVVDSEGKIVRYNRRFLELWNIPAEFAARSDNARLISFVLDQLVDPGTFLRVTRENQVDPGREYFCRLRFKDGRVIERFSRPQLRKGEIVWRILRFRDVTERPSADHEPGTRVVHLDRTRAAVHADDGD